jgi:hypothetical protein
VNPGDTAALARLLRGARIAHLGTLRQGAPLASMTLFLATPGFDAFHLHVSRLAWHTQDLLQDARVALSVAEADDGLARFPAQAVNFELADFSFWRVAPRDARFVAGYGRIHNLSAAELAAASRA